MSAIRNVMKNFARNAELDEFLKQEIGDAGYGGVDVLKTPVGTRITVFVTRPGLVIGRRGVGIRSLTEKIGEKFELQNPQISVLEIEVPELNPNVMCNRIAHNVSRGTAFRRAALWALNSIMNAGAMGAEISVAGKLRSERSHHEKYREGIVPKSGETAKRIVQEATHHVQLKMGLYGIKVKIALKDAIPAEVEIIETKPKEAEPEEKETEPIVKEVKASEPTAPKVKEATPEVKDEAKAEVKTEEETKKMTEAKTEEKPGVKPEEKTESKPEEKTEVKAEVKTEAKSKKSKAKTKTKTEEKVAKAEKEETKDKDSKD